MVTLAAAPALVDGAKGLASSRDLTATRLGNSLGVIEVDVKASPAPFAGPEGSGARVDSPVAVGRAEGLSFAIEAAARAEAEVWPSSGRPDRLCNDSAPAASAVSAAAKPPRAAPRRTKYRRRLVRFIRASSWLAR